MAAAGGGELVRTWGMSVGRPGQVCWAAKAWQRAARCGVLGWVSRWSTWLAKDAGAVMWIRSVPSARRAGRSVAATGRPAARYSRALRGKLPRLNGLGV